jgi:release factor glutamine methyltransferase
LPTLDEALVVATSRLNDASIDQPRRTAGLLLMHLLDVDQTHLITKTNETVPPGDYLLFLELVEQRAAGRPLEYITGRREFFGLDFRVTPDVLIPRPETEHLVEQVIKLEGERSAHREKADETLIADVGTGSGCIAVALAANLPHARIIATDISAAALDIARLNAAHHKVSDRIEFLAGDLLAPLSERRLERRLDIIASNPPYVPAADLEHLQREVREHEPLVALSGGADGLDLYRRLLTESAPLLKPGGYLVCEIGFTQLESIRTLVDSSELRLKDITNDLQGIPRTVTIQKR